MIKKILLVCVSFFILSANEAIKMTKEEMLNWHIKTEKPNLSGYIPIGEYLGVVKAPPSMLYTVSLPFSALVVNLKTYKYESVKKGEVLAEVTGSEWIEAQKDLLSLSIELAKREAQYKIKSVLCEEGIVPQKVCIALKADKEAVLNDLKSKKSLLELFGAEKDEIDDIIKKGVIKKTVDIKAPISGVVDKIFVNTGTTLESTKPLLTLVSTKEKVMDIDLPVKVAKLLKVGDKLSVKTKESVIETRVLQKAQILNLSNQSQRVRLALPSNISWPLDLKLSVKLEVAKKSLKISKISVVRIPEGYLVFKKDGNLFKPVRINILAETKENFFFAPSEEIKAVDEIVVEGAAVLKGMMEGNDG
ncbi:efflux RND transporter periplasmic adaptor subunit [Nitrosophilus alvini]|uniref:efflux RND transporter periplasmic adaptor subunit n=1 Tax=Nitrosophilus alvini TaxID=2714855 RepID=UPI001909EB42|nr:efflux RND transporter periplasmic adaptor subunit [Nitrosophilus alvini]